MVKVGIVPWDVHEALTRAADAGAGRESSARRTQQGGEQAAGASGSAATAHAAFASFWAERHGPGLRAAGTLAPNVASVADAAGEFITMGQDVDTKAEQAVSEGGAEQVTQALGVES